MGYSAWGRKSVNFKLGTGLVDNTFYISNMHGRREPHINPDLRDKCVLPDMGGELNTLECLIRMIRVETTSMEYDSIKHLW